MDILATDLTSILSNVLHILYVAVGLGLVIFFHELGHFAVAKWCGVYVERFSIGFGPILWSVKRGETEYALSAVPFGGYVKMLGQDDMDPSQLTSEEIARDPRSYSNKTVGQRMAIISAGVIMNLITGCIFYMVAFRMGVDAQPAQVGALTIGMPAWQKGLQPGDTLTRLNGRELQVFADIMRGATLSRGDLKVEGVRPNGETFDYQITPDKSGLRRIMGISPMQLRSLTVAGREISKTEKVSVEPDSAASRASTPFQEGDRVLSVNGTKPDSYFQLLELQARRRAETLEYEVERAGKPMTISVPPMKFKHLGLWFEIEKIAALQEGSPAEKAKLQVGDKITNVNGKDVGTEINPLFLADYFESLAGQQVEVQVKRFVDGSPDKQNVKVMLVPTNAPAWIEQPDLEGSPLSIPSIGLAYHLTSVVSKVVADSPAAKAGVVQGATLKSMSFESAEPTFKFPQEEGSNVVQFTDAKKNVPLRNMASALWMMQRVPKVSVTLEFTDEKMKPSKLTPEPIADEHYLPSRGVIHEPLIKNLIADNWGDAFSMGVNYTQGTVLDNYLTLRGLFSGDLSVKNLRGPIGIATAAFEVSQDGISKLLLFLGFLSMNLAVLNFLPIPLLDGGHMVFLLWEGVTRRRPHPRVLEYAQICGFVFVVGLMLFVICLDVFVHKLKP